MAAILVALVACGPAENEGANEAETVGTAHERVTAPVSFVIRLPNRMAPQDVALASSDWLRLADRAKALSTPQGNAPVVNTGSGSTELGVEAITGNLWSQGPVTMRDRSRVNGSIKSASPVTRQNGTVVTGTVTVGPITPLRDSRWEVSLPAQTGGEVNLEPDTPQRELAPGGYGNANIKARASIKLKAGTYLFQSMMLEPQSRVVVDDTEGPVVVYVNSSFTFRGSIEQVRNPAPPSPDLLVVVRGTTALPIEAAFRGTIFAPSTLIRLSSTTHTGTFIGKQVELQAGGQVVHRPFQWSLVLPPAEILMTDAPVILRAKRQHDTGVAEDGVSNPATPVTFTLPEFIPVTLGNAGNGTAELHYRSANNAQVICTFRGPASVMHPTTDLDRARGTRYDLISCNNGLVAGNTTQGTNFRLKVLSGDPQWLNRATWIELHLDGGCSGPLPPPILPDQVVELRENFSWRHMPRLPDRDPTGMPALYYGVIYLESAEQAADLDRLSIFWSPMPLFRSHIGQYRGQCGKTTHAADTRGVLVYAIFQSTTYNLFRSAGIKAELTGIEPPLRMIVPSRADEPGAFNDDDSLSLAALAKTSYPAWLAERRSQQPCCSLPSWDDVEHWVTDNAVVDAAVDWGSDLAGYTATPWDAFIDFVAEKGDDLWEELQQGFQELGLLFADTVRVRLNVTVQNRDPVFGSPLARPGLVRSWGSGAGSKLLPFGSHVRVRQWWNYLPTMDQEELRASGEVDLEAIKDGEGREGSICIELENDEGLMTGDFIPDEICGFSQINLDGFAHDVRANLITDHVHLHALSQIVDSANYSAQVLQHDLHQVQVFTGKDATELTAAINNLGPQSGPRAMTLCLDFPSVGQSALATVVNFAANALSAVGKADPGLGAYIQLAGPALLMKDMWWPIDQNTNDSRGVMTHEMGHFAMCSLLFEESGPGGLSGLLLRISQPGDARDQEYAVMTEAIADTFTDQVVGGTNYFGIPGSSTTNTNNNMQYCFTSPCLESNFKGLSETQQPAFDDEVGRQTTLMHDAFDSLTGQFRMTNNPWNGDVWRYPFTPVPPAPLPPLMLSNTGYIGQRDELVTLPGSAWRSWTNSWLGRGFSPDFNDVLGGLSDAMAAHGFNWCRRCELFALHDNYTPTVPTSPNDMLLTFNDHFQRWRHCVQDGRLPTYLGAPPDANLNMTVACAACPAGQFSDNGTCRACPAGQVPRGDRCECATPGSCTTCPPGQGLQGGVCAPCGPLQGTNSQGLCQNCVAGQVVQGGVCVTCPPSSAPDPTFTMCRECPADAILDWATVTEQCAATRTIPVTVSSVPNDFCPDFWIEVRNLNAMTARGPFQASAQPVVTPTQAQCPQTTTFLDAYTSPSAPTPWSFFGSTQDVGRFVATCQSLACSTGCKFEDSVRFDKTQQRMRFKASGVRVQGIATSVVVQDLGYPAVCNPDI